MARPRGRILTRGADRIPVWVALSLGPTANAASSAVLLGSLNAAALALRPFTIIRTRFLATWESDQGATGERPIGSIGLIKVTDSAVAAGVGSIPTPQTEADADWFVYQTMSQSFVFADATGFAANGQRQYEIDSKAMRKVGVDEDVAVVSQEINAVGATVGAFGRILIKLH